MRKYYVLIGMCVLLMSCFVPHNVSIVTAVGTRRVPDTSHLVVLWHKRVLNKFEQTWNRSYDTQIEAGLCLYGTYHSDSLFIQQALEPDSIIVAKQDLVQIHCKQFNSFIGTAHTHFGSPTTDFIPSIIDLHSFHSSNNQLLMIVIWAPERATITNRENLVEQLQW